MQNQDKEFLGGESLFPLMTGKLPPDEEGIMEKDKKARLIFWSVLVFSFLSGVALVYWSPRSGHWSVIESLGHALMIASMLAGTVDLYAKSRLLKEASKDIAKFLIGYSLPVELQDKIKETMGINLVSRDLIIRYSLSLVSGKPDKLLARVLYTYQVENLSNHEIDYRLRMDFAKHLKPRVLDMRVDSQADRRANEMKEDLSPDEKERPQVSVYSLSPFKVRPKPKNPELRYLCEIKYEIESPVESGDSFSFRLPTINVTLEVERPSNIEVFVPGEASKTNRWYYPNAFLPGDGITFHWRRKPAESTSDQPSQD